MRNSELQSSEFDQEVISFEGARREQLRRWAQLPLEDVFRSSFKVGITAYRLLPAESKKVKSRTHLIFESDTTEC